MSDPNPSSFEDRNIDQLDLAYRQALQYGQDMVALYKQERQKREALEMAYKKLEAAFASMSDVFLVVDKTFHVQEINRAGTTLLNIAAADAHGKPLSALLIGDDTDAFLQQLSQSSQATHAVQLTLSEPLPRTVSIQAAPLPDGGWALVIHDITWEERVNSMREEFLHLAAHELRTPLASVIGFTSMLEHIAASLDDESRAVLNHVQGASEKLRHTINNLINATISDLKETEVAAIDLRAIVDTAQSLLSTLAAERNVAVTVHLPEDSMLVLGNQKQLVTAVGHLIENGLRHNKPGGTLTITGQKNADSYTLTFADTGKGIPPIDLAHILQPFYQVEQHTTRRTVGMGLGLSIVQRILTLHRGRLAVESTLGEGSTFTLTFPRFTADNVNLARQEWLKMQHQLSLQQEKQKNTQQQTQTTIINKLKQQLEITQSQNLAYARDLAKLYQQQKTEPPPARPKSAPDIHTDRLILMGQMAASVAHDLSNLISPILGYSQIILRRRDTIDPTMVNIIERILSISRRANVLLRQMVTLSRTNADKFEVFDLNQLVEEMLHILEIKIKHANIDVTKSYSQAQALIYGSSIQISQVILNIIINAIDAMPAGGVLTIKTSLTEDTAPDFVSLQISDTGQGIAPENLEHIFEAFFTTKQDKSGTGLGLSVTKQIINNHHGRISVDSVLGKGTTFSIFLPVISEDVNETNVSEP